MKKSTKIAFVVLAVLIVAVIPLYYYTRPDTSQPTGTLAVKGAVAKPANLTYTQLAEYPIVTSEVTLRSSGHETNN
jgi:DMSO/TMAO reductase YedYZ molybdopterin-dependent catalytic subunit